MTLFMRFVKFVFFLSSDVLFVQNIVLIIIIFSITKKISFCFLFFTLTAQVLFITVSNILHKLSLFIAKIIQHRSLSTNFNQPRLERADEIF